jgi:hypothetical protein
MNGNARQRIAQLQKTHGSQARKQRVRALSAVARCGGVANSAQSVGNWGFPGATPETDFRLADVLASC